LLCARRLPRRWEPSYWGERQILFTKCFQPKTPTVSIRVAPQAARVKAIILILLLDTDSLREYTDYTVFTGSFKGPAMQVSR